MKRTLRLGLPIAAVAAALIVAGVLLGTTPWSDGPAVQEAAAYPSDYGICNVSVTNIPEDVSVGGVAWPEVMLPMAPGVTPGPSGDFVTLFLTMEMPEGQHYHGTDPDTGQLIDLRTRVVVDAQNGNVIFEHYRTAAERGKLQGVLATLRVGPWEPIGPAWPRTDTPPQSDRAEVVAPADETAPRGKVKVRYHQAERGSGLLGGITSGDSFAHLRVYTCDSVMVIDGWTGSVREEQVVPEEEAMFQRFLEGVEAP